MAILPSRSGNPDWEGGSEAIHQKTNPMNFLRLLRVDWSAKRKHD
jgi:hypothetical protein